jgi:predicted RNase H-like HicB family nuclease
MKLKVVIERGEDSGYVAHVPALKGCWSQGTTRAKALDNVREAIEGWLEVEQDKGDNAQNAADVEVVNI